MTPREFLYASLRPLRIIIGLLAFANFVTLTVSLHVYQDDDELAPLSFMDFQQLLVNGIVFLACVYSFYGRGQYVPSYRATMIWIICTFAAIYSISLLVRIQSVGGCDSPPMTFVKTRCKMQYGISAVGLLWAVLLVTEGTLTFKQSRDLDWLNKERILEEQRQEETAVRYQPDLSLYGGQSSPQDGAPGSTGPMAGGELRSMAVEMEPLPVYMPRPDKNQPMIMDMANRPAPTYYVPPSQSGGENADAGSSSSMANPDTAGLPSYSR
ncbi:hypothetical protein EMPS_10938 [Entomortierella parvispora]|uniref:Uncharacterized protein n=1 Tax=Entomortierella parvispora TaxID=205924 RepID=A0A9P3M1N5_9FUNG|nr:hypothetical protein EMPS_10938 [Entomortierella parvispora]